MKTKSKKQQNCLEHEKNANDQVVIGWESGTSFLNQSQSEEKQNQALNSIFSPLTRLVIFLF